MSILNQIADTVLRLEIELDRGLDHLVFDLPCFLDVFKLVTCSSYSGH